MPKPPAAEFPGSKRKSRIEIPDSDDDADHQRELRSSVGTGCQRERTAEAERRRAAAIARSRSRAAAASPPVFVDLIGDDDDDIRDEEAAGRREVLVRVKEEPLDDPGLDPEPSVARRGRGRGRARAAAASAPVASRKRRREDDSGSRGRGGRRATRSARQCTRGRRGGLRSLRSRPSSSDEPLGDSGKAKRVRRGHAGGGGSGRRDAAPPKQAGSLVASSSRSRKGKQRAGLPPKHQFPLVSESESSSESSSESDDDDDDGEDDDGLDDVCSETSDESWQPRSNSEFQVAMKGEKKVEGGRNSVEEEAAEKELGENGIPVEEEAAEKELGENGNSIPIEEEAAEKAFGENGNSIPVEEEAAEKELGENGNSIPVEEEAAEKELGENGNSIQDDRYDGEDEEATDDAHAAEEEEEEESDEAGEELHPMPNSNADAGGNARSGGEGTPIGKKVFEGLCLVDKADNAVTTKTIGQRTRSNFKDRACLDKKLLGQGTYSKPYCIDTESEEDVPPPPQPPPSGAECEDDGSGGDDRMPVKRRRGKEQIADSDDTQNDSEDSDENRTLARNARKGSSSRRPKNGAPFQQNVKEGSRNYDGPSNPRHIKSYAANAGNPTDRFNMQSGDICFNTNSLLPQRMKHGRVWTKQYTDNLLNSLLDEIENGSAPAQAQNEDRLPLVFSFGDEGQVEEQSDHNKLLDELWAEMDFCMESTNVCPQSCEEGEKSNNGQEKPGDKATLCSQGKHDLVVDEQIGVWCRRCNFIQLEIRHVVADMGKVSTERELRADRELDLSINNLLTSMGYEGTCSIVDHKTGSVWDLVPGVKEGLFTYQVAAIEFMWDNLAGGTKIQQVKNNINSDDLRGCWISHAPGTGKTRSTIAFLQSYRVLFPRSRVLIIAPKAMLATWQDEIGKWNAKVPIHVYSSCDINWDGDETIKRIVDNDEDFAQRLSINKFGRKVRNVLKVRSWCEGGSVLGMSYEMFSKLAKQNSDDETMRKLLLEKTDLLILDEGHKPRNKKSIIWKVLAEVRTKKRIILSGTPFQNNFEELYNVLCLLQGTCDADSKLLGKDEDKGFWTSMSVDNITDERVNEIRKKLKPFLHIYNGEFLQKSLPGLRESVVILNPFPHQKKIIKMLEDSRTKSGTNGHLDFEYKISLASVHPSLITSAQKLPDQVTSVMDKPLLESLRLNPCEGVKTKFVFEIVRLCQPLKERVLVFSQYLQPLDLIMQQLRSEFLWTKDKEILSMSGDDDAETRQKLMNDFNNMESEAKVMLASTKACGEGITLIGASRVVLLDVVWNPSVGRQAIGRAFRIGQKKIVHTYNLIAEGTQEKSKYDRQAQKDHMSKLLFSNETQPAECNKSSEFIISSDKILEKMTEDTNLKTMFANIL